MRAFFGHCMKFSFVFLITLGSSTIVNAQPGDPGGNPDVPITGIEVLVGIGGALGVKRMLKKKNKNQI